MGKTKPLTWFRLHAEFATDPKVQSMSESLQRRFIMLLCLRCGNDLADLDPDELAFALHISEEELLETKRVFLKKGFIDDDWQINNWEWRQYKSDSSADRTRAYRDRLNQKEPIDKAEPSPKQACDGGVTSQDRHSDGGVTSPSVQSTEIQSTEIQSTDKKHLVTDAHSNTDSLTAAQQKTCFDEFYQTYPRKVGKPAAQTRFNQKIKTFAKFSEVMHALAKQKQTDVFNGPRQYIPHPATWLNQERWQDDPNELNNEVDYAAHQRQLEKLSPCERLAYERQERERREFGNVFEHDPDPDTPAH